MGAVPGKLSGRGPAVFIPWTDIERIVLYPASQGQRSHTPVQCIGVQRRYGAPPLPPGNEQAPGCPVPGVSTGATRKITGWRLDRERLAAVTVAVAPGIPPQMTCRLQVGGRPQAGRMRTARGGRVWGASESVRFFGMVEPRSPCGHRSLAPGAHTRD
jgi:hypothetical protein